MLEVNFAFFSWLSQCSLIKHLHVIFCGSDEHCCWCNTCASRFHSFHDRISTSRCATRKNSLVLFVNWWDECDDLSRIRHLSFHDVSFQTFALRCIFYCVKNTLKQILRFIAREFFKFRADYYKIHAKGGKVKWKIMKRCTFTRIQASD